MLRPTARLVLLAAMLALGLPRVAVAQSELQALLDPMLGRQIPRADYRFLYYSDERVTDQPAHLGFTDHRVSFTVPVWQNSRDESTVFANADLDDRGGKDDKLFYYEKRLTGGARFDLRHVGIEVFGGRTFDRFSFEGNSYSDRDENRIDVHDGWFGAARLSVRF